MPVSSAGNVAEKSPRAAGVSGVGSGEGEGVSVAGAFADKSLLASGASVGCKSEEAVCCGSVLVFNPATAGFAEAKLRDGNETTYTSRTVSTHATKINASLAMIIAADSRKLLFS